MLEHVLRQGYLWTGLRLKSMKRSVLMLSRPYQNFFAWQTGCDYRECPFIKSFVDPAGQALPAQQRYKGWRPIMTPFDGELPPPFEIVEPTQWRGAHTVHSPHSLTVLP